MILIGNIRGFAVKDQFFGDEGDFVKYGLLRALAAEGLSLCVAWMKTPPTGKDGGNISYLKKPEDWRSFDPELFDLLQEKVQEEQRDLGALGTSGLFPKNTEFWDLPFTGSNRESYFEYVAKASAGKDILFLDPDNGIGTEKIKPGSDKHVLVDDIRALHRPDQSLVIFQHYPRGLAKLDRCAFANDKAQQLFHCVPAKTIYSVRGKRTALLVVVMDTQEAQIIKALGTLQDRWAGKVQLCKYTLQ